MISWSGSAALRWFWGMRYDDVRKFWDNPDAGLLAPSEIAHHARTVLRYKPHGSNIRALSVGCGNGDLDAQIKRDVGSLCGFDFSEVKVGLARRKNPECEYWNASFLDEWPKSGFDFVFSRGVMQYCHPRDVDRFLMNSLSATTPDAVVGHFDVPDRAKLARFCFAGDRPLGMLAKEIVRFVLMQVCPSMHIWRDGSHFHDLASIRRAYQKKGYSVDLVDSASPYRTHIIFVKASRQ